MIRLIIKGSAEEAREALDARGLLTIMAMDPRPDAGTVVAEVDSRDWEAVARWFAEPHGHEPEASRVGFPAGSLLHYQYIEG